jgi:hypothetical protein
MSDNKTQPASERFDLHDVIIAVRDLSNEARCLMLLDHVAKWGNKYNAMIDDASHPMAMKLLEVTIAKMRAEKEIDDAQHKETSAALPKATQEIADLKVKLTEAEKSSAQLEKLKKAFTELCVEESDPEIDVCGAKRWYKLFDGVKKLHRENDLPAVILADGDQHWYQYGKRHRGGINPQLYATMACN